MKKKAYFLLLIIVVVMSSCTVHKDFINGVLKQGTIATPKQKTVTVTGMENVVLRSFPKTYDKNFKTDSLFIVSYTQEFIREAQKQQLFSSYNFTKNPIISDIDQELSEAQTDYLINFSNFEINNRVETTYSAPVGPGGVGHHTSVEFCVVDVIVQVYDVKTKRLILRFTATGENSVFLFNFSKTLLKAKTKSIKHIINYLKTGKITYKI